MLIQIGVDRLVLLPNRSLPQFGIAVIRRYAVTAPDDEPRSGLESIQRMKCVKKNN